MRRLACHTILVLMATALTGGLLAGEIAGDLNNVFGAAGADSLLTALNTARASGIPAEALENKVREGIAKGRSCREILDAVSARTACLAQIKKENAGVLPDQYTKRLYGMERAHYDSSGKELAGIVQRQGQVKANPGTLRQSTKPAVRKTEGSTTTMTEPQAIVEKQPGQDSIAKGKSSIAGDMESKADKFELRSEEKMEKAEKKAEKIERNMERKMEKEERKAK
jgi:hypothetical protein